jgi:hypothetical protein
LSQSSLDKCKIFFAKARSIGFSTVRITGGEPTLFRNLPELIGIIAGSGFKYTLLTNAIEGQVVAECVAQSTPEKIQISYHSHDKYSEIFGIEEDGKRAVRTIQDLINSGINISLSIACLEHNADEILDLIEDMVLLGVKEYKLIFPNLPNNSLGLRRVFHGMESRLAHFNSDIIIRLTDLSESDCLLKQRGFFSVTLPHFNIYECCATVGESMPTRLERNFSNLYDVVYSNYERGIRAKVFPCISHIGACPTSLRMPMSADNVATQQIASADI